ncbi:Retrovirus-related Pol polyprotein from transposon TNT 1-94 [Dendrobium catenatum]|uniref:Retrovirus-related Pol polyprotein from transposon TNT 1-94 n=1 Tax=Dendrobium catenatum TaxID=906689 RepID=A0A2I0VPC2_9ASPA|nr:Retrovirus-related Pol polyprotein from transposon TNT 1-94 [Dendrobium catenatum]
MQDKTMFQYLSDIKQRVDAIASAGAPIETEDVIFYTLNGLPQSYNAFKTAIRTRAEPIGLDELYALLCSEEVNISEQTAFRGRTRGMSRGRSNTSRGGRISARGTGRRQLNSVVCQICAKQGHSAVSCWYRADLSYQQPPRALIAQEEKSTSGDWFLDTGASSHLTADATQLQAAQPYSGTSNVQVGDGSQLPIANSGKGILPTPSRKLYLSHLLHVPKLTHNLISVSRLLKDNLCYIIFNKSGFLLKDSQTHQILLQGPSHHGLYPINLPFAFFTTPSTFIHWHRRLGHPSPAIQRRLSALLKFSSPSKHHCDSCVRAKSRRLPFSLSKSTTKQCLELLHSDVWGPSPILSSQCYK